MQRFGKRTNVEMAKGRAETKGNESKPLENILFFGLLGCDCSTGHPQNLVTTKKVNLIMKNTVKININ